MSNLKSKSDRRIRYAQRLTGLGLVQVSAWVPEERRWAVSRVAESARVDAAGLAADYTTALVGQSQREMVDSFILSGGDKMALFHKDSDDTRKTVGVKLLVWRCTPVLVPHALTANTNPREVADVNPTLDRIWKLHHYGWETSEYRSLCLELDFDPDDGRPTFLDRYKNIGEMLVAWVSSHYGKSDEKWENEPDWENEPGREDDMFKPQWTYYTRRIATVSVVCDLIDLLRSETYPTPWLLDNVRRKISHLPPGMLPHEDTLRKMVIGEELLEHGRLLARKGKRPATEFDGGPPGSSTCIEFLPSRYGFGYSASIYSSTDGDADGWPKDLYGGLRGVALEPPPERLACSSWLKIVVHRLKEQGVLFMTREQAQSYLDTEVSYWLYGSSHSVRYCRLPEGLTVREPSWGEKHWWRIKRPLLPVDRELVRREALHPVH